MLKSSFLVLALVAALVAAPRAGAEGSFQVFAGQFLVDSEVDSDSRLDVLGLRAGWRVADHWGVEGSVSWIDESVVDLYFGDLSLRWTPQPEARTRYYLLGGAGVLRAELADDVFGEPDEELTAHLGTGVEVDLGRRFVLRPDVRLRWIDDGEGGVHTEATVGVGFRF